MSIYEKEFRDCNRNVGNSGSDILNHYLSTRIIRSSFVKDCKDVPCKIEPTDSQATESTLISVDIKGPSMEDYPKPPPLRKAKLPKMVINLALRADRRSLEQA